MYEQGYRKRPREDSEQEGPFYRGSHMMSPMHDYSRPPFPSQRFENSGGSQRPPTPYMPTQRFEQMPMHDYSRPPFPSQRFDQSMMFRVSGGSQRPPFPSQRSDQSMMFRVSGGSQRPPTPFSQQVRHYDREHVPIKGAYILKVENLSTRVSWQDLKDMIRDDYGIEAAYINIHMQERNTGEIHFNSHRDLEKVLKKMQGMELNGRAIELIDKTSLDRSRSRSRSPPTRRRSRSRSPPSRRRCRSRSPPSRRRSRSRSSSSGSSSRSRSPPSRRSPGLSTSRPSKHSPIRCPSSPGSRNGKPRSKIAKSRHSTPEKRKQSPSPVKHESPRNSSISRKSSPNKKETQ